MNYKVNCFEWYHEKRKKELVALLRPNLPEMPIISIQKIVGYCGVMENVKKIIFSPGTFGFKYNSNLVTHVDSDIQTNRANVRCGWKILEVNGVAQPPDSNEITKAIQKTSNSNQSTEILFYMLKRKSLEGNVKPSSAQIKQIPLGKKTGRAELISKLFIIPWWYSFTEIELLCYLFSSTIDKIPTKHICAIINYCKAVPKVEAWMRQSNTQQKADFTNRQITDNYADSIGYFLYTNTTLVELSLKSNHIGDVVCHFIGIALKVNSTLKKLDLEDNKIGSDGAQALANALETNTTLTELRLGKNQIGDLGAEHIAHAISRNTVVKHISLSDNRITSKGKSFLSNTNNNDESMKFSDF